MDIQLEKLEIMKMLLETENPSILQAVKKVFKKEQKDWWDELPESIKDSIEEGEKEIERGEYVTFEELMLELRK